VYKGMRKKHKDIFSKIQLLPIFHPSRQLGLIV
jgi:uracil-DNA glycosylase